MQKTQHILSRYLVTAFCSPCSNTETVVAAAGAAVAAAAAGAAAAGPATE